MRELVTDLERRAAAEPESVVVIDAHGVAHRGVC